MEKPRNPLCLAASALILLSGSDGWIAGRLPAADNVPETKVISSTEEVLVDLVARDKKGNLILDLNPEELEITDDGVVVKIKNLRLVSGDSVRAAKGQVTDPQTHSDHPHAVRLVSLVFEHFGNEPGRLAREAAEEMLKTETAADLYFAVLLVDRRLRLIQPYTTDRALIRRAVDAAALGARSHSNFDTEAAERTLLGTGSGGNDAQRLLSGDSAAGASGPGTSFVPMMIQTLQESERISRDQQSRPSLAGLLALAQQQGSLPGRKAIVYFCEGLPLTAGTKQALRSVIEASNRSNASVYVVDVSGLSMESRTEAGREMLATAAQASRDMIAMPVGTSVSSSGRGAPANIPQANAPSAPNPAADHVRGMDRAMDAIISDAQESLIELAKSTGGFYLGDSNDLRKPARRLIQDVATYYEATYTPQALKYDGRFHALAVKVDRPSVTVQARSGYVSLPPGTPGDVQPFEAGLLKHFTEPELASQLDFRSEVVPFGREAAGVSASLVVEVPLHQMEFREDGNAKTFELHPMLLALLKNQRGEVVRKFSQDLPYRGALEAKDRMMDGAYTMQRSFIVRPGTFVLEVAVSDGLSGKAGAQRSTVTIPDVGGGLGLSGISMVRRCDALPEGSASGELFRYQNTKVVPSLERTVSREQTLPVSEFFVIYPDAKRIEKPKLEIELSRRGKSIGSFPMELPGSPGNTIPFVASIPAASLSPGPYELAAHVTQGSEAAIQKTTFHVEGPEPSPVVGSGAIVARNTNRAAADPPEDEVPADGAAPTASLRAAITITRIENATRPDPESVNRTLEMARTRAVEYESSLPNFLCIQVTRRLVDHNGQDKWQVKDTITELLRYVDQEEVRRTLEVNGVKAQASRESLRGMLSSGEFGALLRAVFDEKAQAHFEWKELANMANQTCHVFSFRVDLPNSKYALRSGPNGDNRRIVGFHGQVFIDAARYTVRRISIEADNLPPTFPVQQSSIWVNYDTVQIGEHEHMLPSSAEVLVRMGKRSMVKNEITFRDYRRFGAEASIQFAEQ